MRTKTQIRGSKSKGAQFEYSVRDSLIKLIPDIILTKQEGYVTQYDLVSHKERIVIECKKHKGFSWNELKTIFNKLVDKAPPLTMHSHYKSFLIFQANRQPCLVMDYDYKEGCLMVREFKDVFCTPFIKHSDYLKKHKDGKNK